MAKLPVGERLRNLLKRGGYTVPRKPRDPFGKLFIGPPGSSTFALGKVSADALLVVDVVANTATYYEELEGEPSHDEEGLANLDKPRNTEPRVISLATLDLPRSASWADVAYHLVDLLLRGQKVVLQVPLPSVLVSDLGQFEELLAKVEADMSYLHLLTPRQFEGFIAEMLTADGFDVALTKQTRDGGIDILARKRERFGEVLYAYECKKFRSDRPIRVSLVRELATARRDVNASLAVLCATSTFTADAIALAQSHLIYPQDINAIHAWVRDIRGRKADGNKSDG